jgi:hypothetical protein
MGLFTPCFDSFLAPICTIPSPQSNSEDSLHQPLLQYRPLASRDRYPRIHSLKSFSLPRCTCLCRSIVSPTYATKDSQHQLIGTNQEIQTRHGRKWAPGIFTCSEALAEHCPPPVYFGPFAASLLGVRMTTTRSRCAIPEACDTLLRLTISSLI